jgi:hypothetical protein
VLEANTAAPADQQLSDAELVVNSQLLQQQRSSVAAEEAELLSSAPRSSMEQEVQAKRLKALCWDAFQVNFDSADLAEWCCVFGKVVAAVDLWQLEAGGHVKQSSRP